MQFAKKHWRIILVAIVLFNVGCFFLLKSSQANQENLTFVSPKRTELVETLDASGFVDAGQKARLRYLTGGKVTYVGANEGEYVQQGQTLAVIDQASLQKELEKDLNEYMQERWDWEERLDDNENRVLGTTEARQTDKEQWDLDNKVIDVEIRDIAIQNTVLSAPFAGILTSSPTEVTGTQILSTDYFELVDPTTLVFKAEIDESDIAKVYEGQLATITLDAFPGEEIRSFVDYIAFTNTQTTSGTVYLVELPLSVIDSFGLYRLGMNGDVTITLSTQPDTLTIPLISIRQRDDKTYVDVQNELGEIEEREIEIGIETDENVEVLAGLNEQDKVVLPEQ